MIFPKILLILLLKTKKPAEKTSGLIKTSNFFHKGLGDNKEMFKKRLTPARIRGSSSKIDA